MHASLPLRLKAKLKHCSDMKEDMCLYRLLKCNYLRIRSQWI
jgi:hypothetical protein